MAKKTDSKSAPKKESTETPRSSKDEQVGFHKGSLMTLSKERQELVRIIGIVEQLMQMHAAALNELGVKLDEQSGGAQPAPAAQPQGKKRPPIEDIL